MGGYFEEYIRKEKSCCIVSGDSLLISRVERVFAHLTATQDERVISQKHKADVPCQTESCQAKHFITM